MGSWVRAQLLEESTGEWWLAVETTEDQAWCETCGVRAVGHRRRRVVVRDLPLADRPVVLVWAKRLWRCAEPACPARTWSEESDEIGRRAVLTERVRAEIAERVGPEEHSLAQAARDFGVSWYAAMAAVRDHGRPRVDHLARGRSSRPHSRAPGPALNAQLGSDEPVAGSLQGAMDIRLIRRPHPNRIVCGSARPGPTQISRSPVPGPAFQ